MCQENRQGSAIFDSSLPLPAWNARFLRALQSPNTFHRCYKSALRDCQRARSDSNMPRSLTSRYWILPEDQGYHLSRPRKLPHSDLVRGSVSTTLVVWDRVPLPRWFSSHEGQVSRTVATTTFPFPLLLLPPPWFVIWILRPQYGPGDAPPCQ